jgi:hypothetical protein
MHDIKLPLVVLTTINDSATAMIQSTVADPIKQVVASTRKRQRYVQESSVAAACFPVQESR